MSEIPRRYQEFAVDLLKEERIEDAKVMLKVVGEIAFKTELKKKGINEIIPSPLLAKIP